MTQVENRATKMANYFVEASKQHPVQNAISGFVEFAVLNGITTCEDREIFAGELGLVLACAQSDGRTVFREELDTATLSSELGLPQPTIEQRADFLVACSFMPTQRAYSRNFRERRLFLEAAKVNKLEGRCF